MIANRAFAVVRTTPRRYACNPSMPLLYSLDSLVLAITRARYHSPSIHAFLKPPSRRSSGTSGTQQGWSVHWPAARGPENALTARGPVVRIALCSAALMTDRDGLRIDTESVVTERRCVYVQAAYTTTGQPVEKFSELMPSCKERS